MTFALTWWFLRKRKNIGENPLRRRPSSFVRRTSARIVDRESSKLSKRMDRVNFALAMLYQISSTILAAQALVFAKTGCFNLLQLSIDNGKNFFDSYITIVIWSSRLSPRFCNWFFSILLSIITQHWLRFHSVIPKGIIFACLNTLVYYDSFSYSMSGRAFWWYFAFWEQFRAYGYCLHREFDAKYFYDES